MSNKDILISKYKDYIKAMEECIKAERWQEASESCNGGIKILDDLLSLLQSSEEKDKYTSKLKTLKKMYVEITRRNLQRSTFPKNVDDVDPFGVKYVQHGVDVRDFLHDCDDYSITLDDVCGMEREKKIISEIWTRKEKEEYNKLIGYKPPRFYFFYGVPGVGKTFLTRAVLTEVKHRFEGRIPTYTLYPVQLMDYKVGMSERNVSAVWRFIQEHDEFVLFIEDIDQFARNRMHVTFEEERAISTFVTMISSLISLPGKTIIGASSKPYEVDSSVLARVDSMVSFYLPDHDTAYAILEKRLGGRLLPDVDLHSVADRLVESKCTHRGIGWFAECIIDRIAVEFSSDCKQGITRGFDEYSVTRAMIEKAFADGVTSMDEETLIRMAKFRNSLG